MKIVQLNPEAGRVKVWEQETDRIADNYYQAASISSTMEGAISSGGPSPSSEHPRPVFNPTDDEDEDTDSEPNLPDVKEDHPPVEGHQSPGNIRQEDKPKAQCSNNDTRSVSEQTRSDVPAENPDNTSPDEVNTEHPPVPLEIKKTNVFQRKEQNKKQKKPEADSMVHKLEEIDDKSPNTLNKNPEKQSEEGDSGVRLKRELGLLDCVGLILGSIIGSGIFVSPRAVLQYTGSVGMSLAVWALTGLVSMVGALCYVEMGTMIPQSGGSYTYLYEAYGPLPAFLEVWMAVLIGIPGSRAIAALTFANYILQPFFPECQEPPTSALRMVGVLLIFFLTWINSKRVKWATSVQDILALTKVLALVMIIIVGLTHLARGRSQNFDDPMAGTNWDLSFLTTAFYHSLYAYAGWGYLNVIMEELKDPFRNMPRAIAISLTTVTVIYMLTNVAYFAVLSQQQLLSSTAVAVTFGNQALGVMAWTIPIFVACSTVGGLNGSIFGGSRLLFVGARCGHLPKVLSFVQADDCTPITSLVFMAAISMAMFITSDVRVLINYTAFSGNLIGLLSLSTFFWFRIKEPDRHRPVKVWIGFPILYFIISVFLMVFPLIRQPLEVLVAVVIFATAIPVYYMAIHRPTKPRTLVRTMDQITYVCQMLFQAVPEGKER